MAKKLNQLLSIEKTIKGKREDQFTALYRDVQKAELVSGLARTYEPKVDGGERLPAESKHVQVKVEDAIAQVIEAMREVFDVTAAKDAANTVARADLIVDGKTILNVPATHLLWLEKKLAGIADFISKLPTLSPDMVWKLDEGQGLFRSDPVTTVKTKKVEGYTVIVQATKEHPAQTAKTVEDVNVGTWSTTHLSGAITVDRKKKLQERVERYQRAVKMAREEANQVEVIDLRTSGIVEAIFAP